jgi:ATP-dependent RNA helicase DHX8/PRP22
MKDVDQKNGRDLNPSTVSAKPEDDEKFLRNPDRPTSLLEYQSNIDENETCSKKRVQRLSSPEKWEIKQMLAASCIERYNLVLANIMYI